jgi:hypothetical protein
MSKVNYALQLLTLTSLGLSKMSVLCFYRRIFDVYTQFLIVNTILMVIVIIWAFGFFFGTVFQCRNLTWTPEMYAQKGCVNHQLFFNALFISGFLTDLATIVSPLPVIAQLRLPLKNRVAVAFVFLLGAM